MKWEGNSWWIRGGVGFKQIVRVGGKGKRFGFCFRLGFELTGRELGVAEGE